MEGVVKEGLLHGVESISTMQAISISLSGLATVFAALVALALAIKVLIYVLEAMGLGDKGKKPEVKKTVSAAASVSQSNQAARVQEEDTEEYAAIIAAVSAYSRTPVERLKIKSITRIK